MYDYNYKKNGDDWPYEFSTCQNGDQAPIELLTKFRNQPWPLKPSGDELIFINETNPKNVVIRWDYNLTTRGDMTKHYNQFMFNSSLA